MKILGLLLLFLSVFTLSACKDDNHDDTVLNMNDIAGKFWYNNRWVGDKESYTKEDVLQVLKFEKDGKLIAFDFSGRVEQNIGEWTNKNNEVTLKYNDGNREVWDVMHSGGDYLTVIVNEGERRYVLQPEYLQNLTADAYLVNEYIVGNSYKTYVGADLRGNNDVREATMILSEDVIVPLKNYGYSWNESASEYIELENSGRDVRFYIKIGKDNHVKLSDRIYGTNLPYRSMNDFDLNAVNRLGESVLTVTWNPFDNSAVYYRVEIYDGKMDLMNPYFISLPQGSRSELRVGQNTKGEINRMKEMKSGEKYMVRLTSILYEPQVDVQNDQYGHANIQAVTYITKNFIWE